MEATNTLPSSEPDREAIIADMLRRLDPRFAFTWTHPNGRDSITWCIAFVWQIIIDNALAPAGMVDVELLREALEINSLARESIDEDYAMTTNIDVPIVIVEIPDDDGNMRAVIIDGWHRVYKAVKLDKGVLCYMLTTEQERQCRI